jgi:hypothetical protein
MPAEQPVTILSIIPAQGEPGMTVILSGNGFTEGTTVFLAATEIPAMLVGPKQISFEIPELPAGLYALYIKRGDGTTSRTYSFSLSSPKPVVSDLTPDTVYSCGAESERTVSVAGRNFRSGSQLLFDGAAIRSRLNSTESISFIAPQVAGGLHQIQVRSPDGTLSGTLGLMIDAKPTITSVYSGDEYVNYYNLVIEGKNFQQNSEVVIMEEKSLELSGQQLAVDVKRLRSGMNGGVTERDRVVFVNCNKIVYQRFPYSNVTKNFKVQVLNPGSGESDVISVSAP